MKSKLNRKQTLAYLRLRVADLQRQRIWDKTRAWRKLHRRYGTNGYELVETIKELGFLVNAIPDSVIGEGIDWPLVSGKCEICGEAVTETYTCQKCEKEYCDDCSAVYTQFTQIDYDCCSDCGQSKNER